jgi:hypothetical protein
MESNSLYYFFSTLGQTTAALTAIVATVSVFRWQIISQEIDSKRIHICNLFSIQGPTVLHKFRTTFLDKNREYYNLVSNEQRISHLRSAVFEKLEDVLIDGAQYLGFTQSGQIEALHAELASAQLEMNYLTKLESRQKQNSKLVWCFALGSTLCLADCIAVFEMPERFCQTTETRVICSPPTWYYSLHYVWIGIHAVFFLLSIASLAQLFSPKNQSSPNSRASSSAVTR